VAPDIDFVLTGYANVPNGGLHARFPGFYVPIGWTFDGPEQTDTQFHTDVIIRQYDPIADFPLYPLNPIATLNALLGLNYVHAFFSDVSLEPDPTATPAVVSQHGDTTYHFFETKDLPLFGPLRTLGVPESLINVVEPFFRVLVELGYDRSISPGEPTPARLIPSLDPAKVITDLVAAVGEGATNAAALVGLPSAPDISAPVTLAASATEPEKSDMSARVTTKDTPTSTPKTVTETARADASRQGAPAEPANESDPPTSAHTATDTEQSTSPDITETTKATSTADRAVEPSAKPTSGPTPRHVVRDSLDASEQQTDVQHRDKEGRQSQTTTAVGESPKAGSGSSAPDGDSKHGDARGSE
jgi:PE-PPE domain